MARRRPNERRAVGIYASLCPRRIFLLPGCHLTWEALHTPINPGLLDRVLAVPCWGWPMCVQEVHVCVSLSWLVHQRLHVRPTERQNDVNEKSHNGQRKDGSIQRPPASEQASLSFLVNFCNLRRHLPFSPSSVSRKERDRGSPGFPCSQMAFSLQFANGIQPRPCQLKRRGNKQAHED